MQSITTPGLATNPGRIFRHAHRPALRWTHWQGMAQQAWAVACRRQALWRPQLLAPIRNAAHHSTAQHSTTKQSTAQHGTMPCSRLQHGAAWHGAIRHSVIQHSKAAQHSTARQSSPDGGERLGAHHVRLILAPLEYGRPVHSLRGMRIYGTWSSCAW